MIPAKQGKSKKHTVEFSLLAVFFEVIVYEIKMLDDLFQVGMSYVRYFNLKRRHAFDI
jgi:hypothetical protein